MRRARIRGVLGHALEVLLDSRGQGHLEGERNLEGTGRMRMVAVVVMVRRRGLRLWRRPEGIRLQRIGWCGGLHWAEGVWWNGRRP